MIRLSPEQFALILQPSRENARSSVRDKRGHGRTAQNASVSLILCGAGVETDSSERSPREFLTVLVRNLSARGIGILHSQPLETGRRFIVQFSRTTQPPLRILCAVAHCRQLNPRQFTIGAEFVRILNDSATVQNENSAAFA